MTDASLVDEFCVNCKEPIFQIRNSISEGCIEIKIKCPECGKGNTFVLSN